MVPERLDAYHAGTNTRHRISLTVRFHSLEPKDYLPFREFSFDKNIQQVLEYLDLPLQNSP